MIKNIFKTATIYFLKNRTYNIINILGLTVSITSILIILLYIGNESKYDSEIRNKENIYRLGTNWATMPSFIGHFLKNDESEYISDVTRVKMEDDEVNSNDEVFHLKDIGMADANFFDVFNFNFILGNPQNALKTIHSIVLTKSTSERIFGSSDPINKVILLKNKYPFTVTGVVQDPEYFHLPFTAIATLESLKELAFNDILEQKDGWSYFTYIVGKPGLTKDETETKVDSKMKELNYKDFSFSLTSLSDLYFAPPLYYEGITLHGNKQVLYILFSIAVLLLVLAAINFINLTNARANIRYKEIGIKRLMGGSKPILIIQLLVESVQIILIALLFSLFLLKIIQPYFCHLINKQIDFNSIYSPLNLLPIVAFTLLTGILSGLSPALSMNSAEPITLLKSKVDRLSQKSVFGKSLITFQYLISIVLIAGTLMIMKQLNFLKHKDLGFSPEQIMCVEINDNIKAQQDAFKNELLQIPGVLQAAYSGNQMGHDWSNWVNDIDGVGRAFKVNSVEPEYFDLMGITIKEGRAFQKDDVDKCYIINETAVRKYELSNPLEKLMKRDNKYYPIIGVMKDFNFQSPQYPIEPVLFNFRDKKYNLINLKIAANNTKDVLNEIEKVWKKFCPSNVFEYNFMDELYNRQYKSAEQLSSLVGIGGGIAILIACLGILGLSISSSEQRIKEIGIRKINGATISEVLTMLNRDFVKWIVIAFLIATPIAYYAMHKWLENFAYKTELSWWIFALAGVLALGIALLTVSFQSYKAAIKNPVESLRYE
jgi:putative ABC transport system permease protein